MRIQTAIKISAILANLLLIFAVVMGITTDNWYYFMLMYIPVIIWLLLDLKFNYIKVHPIYKFCIPMVTITYSVTSNLTNDPITPLIFIAIIPILASIHLGFICKFKFAIIPLVTSLIAFGYVTYGLLTGIWHPTWLVFLFAPFSIVFVEFGSN